MSRHVLVVLVTALFALTPELAAAAPKDGAVSGTVELGKAKRKRPVLSRGFVERKENAIRPALPYDPRDEVIAVLVDGDIADDDKEPPRQGARYDLLGESFAVPLFPVQAGTEIDIKNRGKSSPRLFSPDDPKLLDSDPISPDGVRSVKVSQPFHTVRIQDRDSAHLIGRIVAFPSPYFSRVDGSGKFEIEGVPPGKWRLRLWYRDGWIEGTDKTVEVASKKTAKLPAITLPVPLEAKPAQGTAGAEKAP